MTNFQKVIREIIDNDPERQAGVAGKLGVTDAYISNFATGSRRLSKKVAKKLEELYGYDAEKLLNIQAREDLGEVFTTAEPMATYRRDGYDKSKDAISQLRRVTKTKKTNSGEGRLVDEDSELVPVPTFIIPIKGFASLKKHFFADEFIEKHFEETIVYVRKTERAPYFLKVQSTGESMPPIISEGDFCNCEPIPQMDWLTYKFRSDKIYCFFHHMRGILFKRVNKVSSEQLELISDNPDKKEYPTETFDIGEFKKILIVRTVEKQV